MIFGGALHTQSKWHARWLYWQSRLYQAVHILVHCASVLFWESEIFAHTTVNTYSLRFEATFVHAWYRCTHVCADTLYAHYMSHIIGCSITRHTHLTTSFVVWLQWCHGRMNRSSFVAVLTGSWFLSSWPEGLAGDERSFFSSSLRHSWFITFPFWTHFLPSDLCLFWIVWASNED